jgi:predicted RNA-binding protein YlqC (UPF0109 family)
MTLPEKFSEIIKLTLGKDFEFTVELIDNELLLDTDEENLKFIIGRGGRNINAFREILYVYNKLHDTNYFLELKPEKEEREGE